MTQRDAAKQWRESEEMAEMGMSRRWDGGESSLVRASCVNSSKRR